MELETIELTAKEEQIFGRLLDVVNHFDLGTQHRVAGGWVRDKLLGEESADIDIALDNMTGQNFRVKVVEYAELIGEEKPDAAVIPCNPNKSKHLETATMSIFGVSIDFVNLRSEKYVESSRIPTMEIGTAKEDAYHRDLTINSLFFNINNNSVEDLTGRDIEDLKKGLTATPLPSKSTFLDDPLRVLRAIRFAARLDFTLSDELKEAASDKEVKTELEFKISRERVGKEIDYMMVGNRPVEAMSYIRDLGLFDVVFAFPKKSNPPVFYNCDRCCISHIEAAWNLAISVNSSTSHPVLMDGQPRVYLYSALLFPLRKMFHLDKKSKIHVTSYIIQESLKLDACLSKSVESIHGASKMFAEVVLLFESNDVALGTLKEDLEDVYLGIPTHSLKRVFAGLILEEIKDLWRVALLISMLSYPEAESAGDTLSQQDELHRRREKYIQVEHFISSQGLGGVWKWKPLLNGNAIMEVMQLKRGRLVGEWKRRVFKWQLAHPKGTVDDCIDWMKQWLSKPQKL